MMDTDLGRGVTEERASAWAYKHTPIKTKKKSTWMIEQIFLRNCDLYLSSKYWKYNFKLSFLKIRNLI